MNKESEKRFGDILRKQNQEIDSGEVWMNIKDRLPKSRRSRFPVFLLLLIAGGLGLGLIFYGSISKSNIEKSDFQISTEIKPNEKNTIANPKEQIIVNDTPILEANPSESKSTFTTAREVQRQSHGQNLRGITNRLAPSSQRAIASSTIDKSVELALAQITDEGILTSKEIELNAGGGTNIEEEKDAGIEMASGIVLQSNGNEVIDEKSMLLRPTYVTGLNLQVHSDKPNLNLMTKPIRKLQSTKHSLIVMAGGNLVNFKHASPLEDIVQLADQESSRWGLSAGVMYGRRFINRWTIKAGISYYQNIARYTDQSSSFELFEEEGISQIDINAQGIATPLQGQIEQYQLSVNDIQWHRYHEGINIEARINKEVCKFAGLRLSIEAGMTYNLWTSSRGYAFEGTDQISFTKLDSDQTGFYRPSFGLRPLGGIEFTYNLGPVDLILNGNYIWGIYPINTNTELFKTKNSQTGVQLGMRYYLNGN